MVIFENTVRATLVCGFADDFAWQYIFSESINSNPLPRLGTFAIHVGGWNVARITMYLYEGSAVTYIISCSRALFGV